MSKDFHAIKTASNKYKGTFHSLQKKNFSTSEELKNSMVSPPTVTVIGVGGCGGNTINSLISKNIHGVKFIAANTDAQALNTLSPKAKKNSIGRATYKRTWGRIKCGNWKTSR